MKWNNISPAWIDLQQFKKSRSATFCSNTPIINRSNVPTTSLGGDIRAPPTAYFVLSLNSHQLETL